MSYHDFDNEKRSCHELSDGYTLHSAPDRLFGVSYAIYRADPEFDEFLDYGSDLEGLNYCFWILRNGQRIGGIILRPNHIEGLFMQPPHTCAYEALRQVMPLLTHWSDKAKPVEAVNVMPDELELYQRLGFRISNGRRVYIRPTEPLTVDWGKQYRVARPTNADAAEIAALYHVGYRDYPPEWELDKYSHEEWLRRVEKRLSTKSMSETCRNASTLVREASGKLVGACLVGVSRSTVRPDVEYAKVTDISVHPDHRLRGLGSRMLQEAISHLYGHYPVLKFGVATGNAAEAFYYSQGFRPGPAEHTLILRL